MSEVAAPLWPEGLSEISVYTVLPEALKPVQEPSGRTGDAPAEERDQLRERRRNPRRPRGD